MKEYKVINAGCPPSIVGHKLNEAAQKGYKVLIAVGEQIILERDAPQENKMIDPEETGTVLEPLTKEDVADHSSIPLSALHKGDFFMYENNLYKVEAVDDKITIGRQHTMNMLPLSTMMNFRARSTWVQIPVRLYKDRFDELGRSKTFKSSDLEPPRPKFSYPIDVNALRREDRFVKNNRFYKIKSVNKELETIDVHDLTADCESTMDWGEKVLVRKDLYDYLTNLPQEDSYQYTSPKLWTKR